MKYRGIKKLYYSISEISDMLDIKQSVIRYWETEFKELKPQKNRAGNRIYKKEDIGLIRLIDYYIHGKHLSIQEAGEIIRDLKSEGLYERKLQEIMSADNDEQETGMPDSAESEEVSPGSHARDENESADEERAERISDADKGDTELKSTHEESKYKTGDEISTDSTERGKSAETDSNPLITDIGEENQGEEVLTFPAEEEKVESFAQAQSAKAENERIITEAYEKQIRQHEEEQKVMRELLRKISCNIRDIINILNENVR